MCNRLACFVHGLILNVKGIHEREKETRHRYSIINLKKKLKKINGRLVAQSRKTNKMFSEFIK